MRGSLDLYSAAFHRGCFSLSSRREISTKQALMTIVSVFKTALIFKCAFLIYGASYIEGNDVRSSHVLVCLQIFRLLEEPSEVWNVTWFSFI